MDSSRSCGVDELNESLGMAANQGQSDHEIGSNGVCDPKTEKSASPSPTTKGYGLKKWRRIRRDFSKDGSNALDSNKNLKRGLPNANKAEVRPSGITNHRHHHPSSPTTPITTTGGGFAMLDLPSSFAFGAADSDNSTEDQSSKCSTAASAPKFNRFTNPTRDRTKGKKYSPGGIGIGNGEGSAAQLGKGTTKKFRGDIDKDNSYSSLESDLRTSNATFSGIVGHTDQRSSNYDGESSFEAQASNQHSSEEVRMDAFRGNGGEPHDDDDDDDDGDEDEGVELSWEEKDEESINFIESSTSHDPLAQAVVSLQAVQDALQEEIDKFRELGKESTLLPGDVTHDLETHGVESPSRLHPEEVQKLEAPPEKEGLLEMKHKICVLEEKLEDTLHKLEMKVSMVAELEDIVRRKEFPVQEGSAGSQNVDELEVEVESLYRQKIEAELEYVAITRTTQELKVGMKDQIAKLEERGSLHKGVVDVESRTSTGLEKRKGRGERDESCSNRERVGGEEVLVGGEDRICRYAVCFFVQLIMLVVAFVLSQQPKSSGTVPT